jgi:uncharacterized damage-inducible protein DinB
MRQDPDPAGDERTTLIEFLDYHRVTVLEKIGGLDHEQMNRQHLPSGTTIAGLVKHLALVEDSWFQERLIGAPTPEPWASAPLDDDVDWDFHSAHLDTPEELTALYEAACGRSRAALATVPDLGTMAVAANRRGEVFSARWILVHMIEETARHNGHLDVLRELTDGATGE